MKNVEIWPPAVQWHPGRSPAQGQSRTTAENKQALISLVLACLSNLTLVTTAIADIFVSIRYVDIPESMRRLIETGSEIEIVLSFILSVTAIGLAVPNWPQRNSKLAAKIAAMPMIIYVLGIAFLLS